MWTTRYNPTREVGANHTACTKLLQEDKQALHWMALERGLSDYELPRPGARYQPGRSRGSHPGRHGAEHRGIPGGHVSAGLGSRGTLSPLFDKKAVASAAPPRPAGCRWSVVAAVRLTRPQPPPHSGRALAGCWSAGGCWSPRPPSKPRPGAGAALAPARRVGRGKVAGLRSFRGRHRPQRGEPLRVGKALHHPADMKDDRAAGELEGARPASSWINRRPQSLDFSRLCG